MEEKNTIDYRADFTECCDFLGSNKDLWSQEVLNNYPQSFQAYPSDWLTSLQPLSDQDQWLFECRQRPDHMLTEKLVTPLAALEHIDSIPNSQTSATYPSWAFQHVTGKKQHEITCLAQTLEHHYQQQKLRILDIGGGIGHLARTLGHYHGHQVTTLDQNETLQELGRKRLHKYPVPAQAGEVSFCHHHFGESSPHEHQYFQQKDLSIGLHTCGPLALHHLKQGAQQEGQALINVGCCYHKLGKSEVPDVMISNAAGKLTFSKYALTLAARGRPRITFAQFELKKRVKFYRAALHLYLYHEYNVKDFMTMGSALPKLYRQDFATYALHHYPVYRHHLKGLTPSPDQLNHFYQRPFIQQQLTTIFNANLIRWQYSRLLEKTLLLDRVLWLREQGHEAHLYQIFDAAISPRNVMVTINLPL